MILTPKPTIFSRLKSGAPLSEAGGGLSENLPIKTHPLALMLPLRNAVGMPEDSSAQAWLSGSPTSLILQVLSHCQGSALTPACLIPLRLLYPVTSVTSNCSKRSQNHGCDLVNPSSSNHPCHALPACLGTPRCPPKTHSSVECSGVIRSPCCDQTQHSGPLYHFHQSSHSSPIPDRTSSYVLSAQMFHLSGGRLCPANYGVNS